MATDTKTQLPLFGYDVVPTGEQGVWTVKARKPDSTLMRPTMRVSRAAQIAQCSVQTIYVAILAGEVEADNVTPHCKRVFTDSLYRWVEARRDMEHWTAERKARWQAADRQFNSRQVRQKPVAKKARKT
jgi:hypothetical protein